MEPSVENEGGQRDDILQLRAQLNLLKELNQLKDERMQELAVRSNVEQVKLQEEGAQLAQDNSALREVVHGLNKDVLRLEHEVDGLKSANNGEYICCITKRAGLPNLANPPQQNQSSELPIPINFEFLKAPKLLRPRLHAKLLTSSF